MASRGPGLREGLRSQGPGGAAATGARMAEGCDPGVHSVRGLDPQWGVSPPHLGGKPNTAHPHTKGPASARQEDAPDTWTSTQPGDSLGTSREMTSGPKLSLSRFSVPPWPASVTSIRRPSVKTSVTWVDQ